MKAGNELSGAVERGPWQNRASIPIWQTISNKANGIASVALSINSGSLTVSKQVAVHAGWGRREVIERAWGDEAGSSMLSE